MRKKIVALLMAVVSCFSLGATAFAAENPEQTFKDVEPGTWYYEGVEYVNERGLMTGMGGEDEGYFKPDEYLQRQDLALILARYYQKNINSDLDLDETNEVYYANAVAWVNKYNIMTGYSSGDFGIGDPIIRQDMCLALYNHQESIYPLATAAVVPNYGLIHLFPDGYLVSSYAGDQMFRMVQSDVIQGEGTDVKLLNPHGKVTRGMAAVMLQRYLEEYEHYLIKGHKDMLL